VRARYLRFSLACVLVAAAASTPSRAHASGKAIDGAVNLNTAPPEILGLLPGIGPAKAATIIAYRKRHPFRTVDELVRIKGIGRKMVRRWRSHLAVAGPTTATATTSALTAPPPSPALARHAPTPVACARPIVRAAPSVPRAAARATHGACPLPP
jgi:competence ComEA-like helix-hairpin-helix protein